MPQINRTYYEPKDIDVKIAEINDGIYRISGYNILTNKSSFTDFS